MKTLLVALGGFLALGLFGWFAIDRHDKNIIRQAMTAQAVKQNDSTETILKPQSDSLRTVFVNQKVPYVVYRDRVIHDNPKDTTLHNIIGKCDQLILTCEQRQSIDSARISNLQSEVKTLKSANKVKPNRISAFITGGMDFIATRPLIQAGAEVRVIGPLALTAFAEGSQDKERKTDVRGVVGIKFNFR